MNIEGKIWGVTSELFRKNNVKINRAVIKGGFCSSKHCHPSSYNMFFVERGGVEVVRWKNDYDLVDRSLIVQGQSCIVPPGEYHRFVGTHSESVVYEIYWTELLDDIVREDHGGVYTQELQ